MILFDALNLIDISLADILDIVLVALVFYAVYGWIRGSSAMNIFTAILLLLIVRIVAVAFGMKMTSALLGTVLDVGVIAIIVIFQPEIRRFLNNLGRNAGKTIHRHSLIERLFRGKVTNNVTSDVAKQIALACEEMSEQKCGALILIARNVSLENIIETGDVIDARICSRLIRNIFFKNSPLHDGAMVISEDRIVAARCTLPITERTDIPPHYGMRHKAAIGVSEQCDAYVIVVSEETGAISFVHSGEISKVDNINSLSLLLGGIAE